MKLIITSLVITSSLILTGCTTPQPTTPAVTNTAQISIPTGSIYFYSATCSHCQTVRTYIDSNHIKDSSYFLELEVSNNQNNAAILKSVGARCLISENDLSVPLFWDGKTCYSGSDEVIKYLTNLVIL